MLTICTLHQFTNVTSLSPQTQKKTSASTNLIKMCLLLKNTFSVTIKHPHFSPRYCNQMSINRTKTYLTICVFNLPCLSSPIKWIIGPAEPPELWMPWTQRDISGEILSKCECAIFIRSVNYLACGRHTASFCPLKCIID